MVQEVLTNKTVEKLKHDLVKEGMVTYDELDKAQEIAEAQSTNLAVAFIKSGLIEEELLLKFIESKLHIPYVNLDDYRLDEKSLSFIDGLDARKYRIVPLFKIEDVLTVAMADPMDLFVINNLIKSDELKVEPIICSEGSILKAIDKYYFCKESEDINLETSEISDWREFLNNEKQDEAHLKCIIEAILRQAVTEGVHELFFEHQSFGLNVIFRKDGEVQEKGEIPSLLIPLFISKVKSMSKLDPEESELPQLGKLVFKLEEIEYISSVSAFPTISGERIAIKIYSPPKKLGELNIPFEKIEYIKKVIQEQGIMLVCGSGLSGKTHVIYSLLQEVAKKQNAMTIESIVKYDIDGVNQCEVNENVGFNLDKAMRFIEFQSPDVIYFEGLNTKSGLEYFISLALKNKLVITEFLSDSMADLRQRFSFNEFDTLKKLITCLVFVHNKDSIEIFTQEELERFI